MLCGPIKENDIEEISKWKQYEIDLYTPLSELKNMHDCSKRDEFNWLVFHEDNDIIADTYFELDNGLLYYMLRVNPDFQNKGYAKDVFFTSLEHLKKNGVLFNVVIGVVDKENYRAIKLHESLGFKLCETETEFLTYKYYI